MLLIASMAYTHAPCVVTFAVPNTCISDSDNPRLLLLHTAVNTLGSGCQKCTVHPYIHMYGCVQVRELGEVPSLNPHNVAVMELPSGAYIELASRACVLVSGKTSAVLAWC